MKEKIKILTISSNEIGGHPIKFAKLFNRVGISNYINFNNPLNYYIKKSTDSAKFHGYDFDGISKYYLPVVGNSNFSFISSLYILIIKFFFKDIKIISYGSFNSHLFISPDYYITYGSDLHEILNSKYLKRSNLISHKINKMKMRIIFKNSKKIFIDMSFFLILDDEFKKLIEKKISPIPYISLFEDKISLQKKSSDCLSIILLSRIEFQPEGITDDKNILEILNGINKLAGFTKKKIEISLRNNIYIKKIKEVLNPTIKITIINPIKRKEYHKIVSGHDIAIDTLGLPVLNYSAVESTQCGVITITNFNSKIYRNLLNPPIIKCKNSSELFLLLKKLLNQKNRSIYLRKINLWRKKIKKNEIRLTKEWFKSFNLNFGNIEKY